MAAQRGHLEVLQLLGVAKADLDKATDMGSTPAFMSVPNCHMDILKLPMLGLIFAKQRWVVLHP